MRRIVLDSNVLISAFIAPRGACGQIFNVWEQKKFELIISEYIINETSRILKSKINLPVDFVHERIQAMYDAAEIVEPEFIMLTGLEENDLPILGTALAGYADSIVTGDQMFLRLERFEGIDIITSRELLERLHKDHNVL